MYQVSDRSVRKYKQNLREGRPFHIYLRTREGSVDILIGADGQAMMLNKDNAKYDALLLGDGSHVVDLIKADAPIPGLKVWWDVKDDDVGAAEQSPGYQVLPQRGEPLEEPDEPILSRTAALPARSPKTPGRTRDRVASSALKLVEAYRSGKRQFRMWDDSLCERADGTLAWEFGIYRRVDGRWHTIGTVTVAVFTPAGIEFPAGGEQYRAVMARRALLTSGPPTSDIGVR